MVDDAVDSICSYVAASLASHFAEREPQVLENIASSEGGDVKPEIIPILPPRKEKTVESAGGDASSSPLLPASVVPVSVAVGKVAEKRAKESSAQYSDESEEKRKLKSNRSERRAKGKCHAHASESGSEEASSASEPECCRKNSQRPCSGRDNKKHKHKSSKISARAERSEVSRHHRLLANSPYGMHGGDDSIPEHVSPQPHAYPRGGFRVGRQYAPDRPFNRGGQDYYRSQRGR